MKIIEAIFFVVMGICFALGESLIPHIMGIRYAHLLWLLIPVALLYGLKFSRQRVVEYLVFGFILFLIPVFTEGFYLGFRPVILCLNFLLVPSVGYLFKARDTRKLFFYGVIIGASYSLAVNLIDYTVTLKKFFALDYQAAVVTFRDILRFEFALRPGFLIAYLTWNNQMDDEFKLSPVLIFFWGVVLALTCAGAESRGIIISLAAATLFFFYKAFVLKRESKRDAALAGAALAAACLFYFGTAKLFESHLAENSQLGMAKIEKLGISDTGSFTKPGGTVKNRFNLWAELFAENSGMNWAFGKAGWRNISGFQNWKDLLGVHNWLVELVYRIGFVGLLIVLGMFFRLFPPNKKLFIGLAVIAPVAIFNDYFWLAPAWLAFIPPNPKK